MALPPRGLVLSRGSREETEIAAAPLVVGLEVARLGGCDRAAARRLLGQSLDVVVVDGHDGLLPEVLGQVEGLIRAGGCLALRLPAGVHAPAPMQEGLQIDAAAPPSARWWDRLEGALRDAPELRGPAQPTQPVHGSEQQAAWVADVCRRLQPGHVEVLLARRGRGKSYACARVAEALSAQGKRVVIAGPSEAGVRELRLGFGGARVDLNERIDADVLIVDEAAQIPLPELRAVVRAHPGLAVVFATTVHGYEGTGRGFEVRFVPWLERNRKTCVTWLHRPIRWSEDDPLERWMDRLLMLSAEPAGVGRAGEPQVRPVSQDELASDDELLEQVLGLLADAHYRTTPGDLHRLLDAPNLLLYALQEGQDVVGVNLVAREGSLEPRFIQQMVSGARRVRGHALADTLACHLAWPEVAALPLLRSVRLAVHPERRGRGYARRLVDAVHAAHPEVAVFGTLFGGAAGVVRLRKRLGYRVLRLSSRASPQSGEHSVVMVREGAAPGAEWVSRMLRAAPADLNAALRWSAIDTGRALDEELLAELDATTSSDWPLHRRLRAYARGPLPFEAVAPALALRDWRDPLVVERLRGTSWMALAESRGQSVRVTMRQFRQAVIAELEHVEELQ